MKKNWQGKKVLVIGAARQGLAATRYLAKNEAEVLLNDCRPASDFPSISIQFKELPVQFHFGSHPLELLRGKDLLCVSGGVPLDLPIIHQAKDARIPLTNDSQIFMEAVKSRVIGITGSAGKTTTTIILGAIAKEAVFPEQKVWVGGNIGYPMIDHLEEIKEDDWVILELSSFQLELMSVSPHMAVILNITPNHLDRHKSMEAYISAKSRILQFQKEGDIAVINREEPGAIQFIGKEKGRLLTFGFNKSEEYPGVFSKDESIRIYENGEERELIKKNVVQLPGEHNFANALAACAASYVAGFNTDAMSTGIRSVQGIPHRLETVREHKGIRWVNDSIATAPERVIAAVRSTKASLVLLLGGRDKDLPWEELANLLYQVKPKIILFGESAGLIEKTLKSREKGKGKLLLFRFSTLKEAVLKAAEIAEAGETVMLSPGGTSYDAYRDFEERGEHFRKLVEELT